jgi:hypothetical protein
MRLLFLHAWNASVLSPLVSRGGMIGVDGQAGVCAFSSVFRFSLKVLLSLSKCISSPSGDILSLGCA